MADPLISIILPTYNGERFLQKQIESLFSQSCQDFEIIIADDASTDSTVEILQQYSARDNFHYSVNDKNIGFMHNFRNAMQRAKGVYIAPCDQDDIWLPGKLQTLLDEMDTNLLVYSNSELVDESDRPLGRSLSDSLKINFISGNNHRAFYYGNCVAAHTMLFHRKLVDYIDTFPESVYHDHWLAFVASRLGTIHGVDKKLVLYRRHDQSVTRTIKKKKFTGNIFQYLNEKAARQLVRNRSKLVKLKEFQAFNQKIDKPDWELDTIIRELEKFEDYFFNRKIYAILAKNREQFFAISRKSQLGLVAEECFGMKYYKYIPLTL